MKSSHVVVACDKDFLDGLYRLWLELQKLPERLALVSQLVPDLSFVQHIDLLAREAGQLLCREIEGREIDLRPVMGMLQDPGRLGEEAERCGCHL